MSINNCPINLRKNCHDSSKVVQPLIIKVSKKWHDLPKDLQLRILKKIPLENLRMMYSSKQLRFRVTSASLMLETGTRDTGYHIYSYASHGKLAFLIVKDADFKQIDVVENIDVGPSHTVIGSCCGLVCFVDTFNPEFSNLVVVWNPYLGKSLTIPTPSTSGVLGYGFGFDTTSVDFKVDRIGIMLLNNTKMWANIDSLYAATRKTVFGSFARPILKIMDQGIFLNGVLHWIVKVGPKCIGEGYDNGLLIYNLTKEKFEKIVIIPRDTAHDNMVLTTLMIDGRKQLSIYHHDHECQVWVLKSDGLMHFWRQICILHCGNDFGKILNGWIEDRVTFSLNTGSLYSINLQDEQMDRVSVNKKEHIFLDYVGPYVESLAFPMQQLDGQN